MESKRVCKVGEMKGGVSIRWTDLTISRRMLWARHTLWWALYVT